MAPVIVWVGNPAEHVYWLLVPPELLTSVGKRQLEAVDIACMPLPAERMHSDR